MATIADVRGGVESPQFAWSWEVEIQGLVDALQDITLYAKTVTIPETTIEPYIRDYKASKVSYASRDGSAKTATLTFMDDEALSVLSFFNNWVQLIRNDINGAGVGKSLYAADLVIRLQKADGETVSGEVRLGGAWPTSVSEIQLDYTNSEAIEISVTLQYDTKIVTAG